MQGPPVPFGTEIHYEWLEQGSANAGLSESTPFSPAVVDFRQLSASSPAAAAELVARLKADGVVLLSHTGVEGTHMLHEAEKFFAQSALAKGQMTNAPAPGPALQFQPAPYQPVAPQPRLAPPPPERMVYMKTRVEYTPPRIERLNPFAQPDVKETFDWGLPIDEVSGASHLGVSRFPNTAFKAVAEPYVKDNARISHTLVS